MKAFTLSLLVLFAAICHAQVSPKLVVHEWGTFTAKYSDLGIEYLDLHKHIDEPVPDFVHHINFDTSFSYVANGDKGEYYRTSGRLELEDISIKMETPVLYFYADEAIDDLLVDVRFPSGSISEFYPKPVLLEDYEHFEKKIKIKNNETRIPTYPYLTFKKYSGYAQWQINVLPPEDKTPCTEPDETVPNMWLAPRKTKANKIESDGEIEKYIFYRGLGGFSNPIHPVYTKEGNLLVQNCLNENVPYCLVYERTSDGSRFIWGTGQLEASHNQIFIRSRQPISDQEWNTIHRSKFIDELVQAGLFKDEAEAMLNTWDHSYFGSSGIKIFWVVPRNFTDSILPINFSKPVSTLERVMVGRTEIDDWNDDNTESYVEADSLLTISNSYSIYPNPTNSEVYFKSSSNDNSTLDIKLFNLLGQTVLDHEVNLTPMKNPASIRVAHLEPGMYLLHIKQSDQNIRVIIR